MTGRSDGRRAEFSTSSLTILPLDRPTGPSAHSSLGALSGPPVAERETTHVPRNRAAGFLPAGGEEARKHFRRREAHRNRGLPFGGHAEPRSCPAEPHQHKKADPVARPSEPLRESTIPPLHKPKDVRQRAARYTQPEKEWCELRHLGSPQWRSQLLLTRSGCVSARDRPP